MSSDVLGNKATWTGVCTRRQLMPERGVAVLVGDVQIALFRITGTAEDGSTTDFVYAVGHKDPACDANVMARGIVGSVTTAGGQRDTVASPMYKDVYDLATGECYTRPELRLPVYRTWVAGGVVYVEADSKALAPA